MDFKKFGEHRFVASLGSYVNAAQHRRTCWRAQNNWLKPLKKIVIKQLLETK